MPEECWLASKNSYVEIEENGWIRSTFYAGVSAVYNTFHDSKYLDKLIEWGDKNNWQPALRPRHADDHCCIQTYADLYQIKNESKFLKPAIETFDKIVKEPMLGSQVGWKKEVNWNWCDALFMAPPAMTKLAAVTKNWEYLDIMDQLFWDTYEYLYDKDEHLFYRDARFKPDADPLLKSDNGKPIFWSRGNGWVLAGLARILEAMPNDYKSKIMYEELYQQMSTKLVSIQDENGFWHSNLLDHVSSPEPESSGTAFFCYGLAWGINNGNLEREKYLPSVKKAWI